MISKGNHVKFARFVLLAVSEEVICQKLGLRASSRVPNTEKQMKARGRRPSAFICFEVFGTRDEARSPSF